MNLNIAILSGDGIGPEIINEALKITQVVAEKFNHQLTYKQALTGATAIEAVGDPYPEETHAICMASDAVLFGAIGHPKYDNDPNAKVRPEQGLLKIRKELGLSKVAADAQMNATAEAEAQFSGVSLDTEAANLLEQQQAYQASARILQTARELFDTLLQSV